MRRAGIAALPLLLMLTAPFAAAATPAGDRAAPEFAYRDVNPRSASHGETIALDDLVARGGVVLNFIASWCGPCWMELPEFESLYAAGGAPIVAVAADEYTQPAAALMARLDSAGVTMPVLLVPEADIGEMERRYDHAMLPATYVIDGDGRIRQVFQGLVSNERLVESVRDHLADAGRVDSPSAPSP